MQQVRLGRSSLRLSRLSLGAMGFGDTNWRSWVLALDDSRAIFRRDSRKLFRPQLWPQRKKLVPARSASHGRQFQPPSQH